jgi:hypothetical protein
MEMTLGEKTGSGGEGSVKGKIKRKKSKKFS